MMTHHVGCIERSARTVERHVSLAPPNWLLEESVKDLLKEIASAREYAQRAAVREAEHRERMVVAEYDLDQKRKRA